MSHLPEGEIALNADATLQILAALVVAVGALLQGSIGFGLSLLSVPFLVMIDPTFVPGPLLAAGVVLTLLMSVRSRASIDLSGVGIATLGRLAGTIAGAGALLALPGHEIRILAGALVLLGVALSASGLHPRPTAGVLVTAGLMSGFMGTTATVGGPPLALVYQHADGERLRGNMAGNLFIGALLSLVAIGAVGRFGLAEVRAAGVLVPGVVVGFLASTLATRWIDGRWARPLVLTVSALGGLSVLVRELTR